MTFSGDWYSCELARWHLLVFVIANGWTCLPLTYSLTSPFTSPLPGGVSLLLDEQPPPPATHASPDHGGSRKRRGSHSSSSKRLRGSPHQPLTPSFWNLPPSMRRLLGLCVWMVMFSTYRCPRSILMFSFRKGESRPSPAEIHTCMMIAISF